MERALNDMRNLPNVITEFLSLYADANTANNFLSLDEDGNISDTAYLVLVLVLRPVDLYLLHYYLM
jgi:hypothetical protein